MVPAIEWHLLHPHSMRSSFGSVGPKFVPPPHAPGSPPCCQQVGPPKTTCKEGKWPKQSIQGSCGCPCSLLGIWTRWPLGIPSNSDHCVSGGKTQDFSIPFGGYLGKQQQPPLLQITGPPRKETEIRLLSLQVITMLQSTFSSCLVAGSQKCLLSSHCTPPLPTWLLQQQETRRPPPVPLRGTSCRPGGFGVDTVVVVGFGSSAGAAAIYTSVSLIAVPVY